MRRRVPVLAVLAAGLLFAQTSGLAPVLVTLAGTGAAVQVYPAGGVAVSIQYVAPSANSANVMVGGSTVTGSVGLPMVPGSGFYLPPIPVDTRLASSAHYYDLSKQYAYISTGDTLSVLIIR